jgi:hypothetical protein
MCETYPRFDPFVTMSHTAKSAGYTSRRAKRRNSMRVLPEFNPFICNAGVKNGFLRNHRSTTLLISNHCPLAKEFSSVFPAVEAKTRTKARRPKYTKEF